MNTHTSSTRSPLVAALLVVALAALGCGIPHGLSDADALEPTTTPSKAEPSGPFAVDRPEIARLDPDLRAAVQAAARDARADGVRMVITSGWRSRAHQQRLLDEAVAKYGSEAEARKYVATPDTSAHVTGDAVDIGPTDADSWLSQHGADYGLCQSFANEMWHFELATEPGGQCPVMFADGSSRS